MYIESFQLNGHVCLENNNNVILKRQRLWTVYSTICPYENLWITENIIRIDLVYG